MIQAQKQTKDNTKNSIIPQFFFESGEKLT